MKKKKSRSTTNFKTFFITVKVPYYYQCTIKVVFVIVPCESNIIFIIFDHLKCYEKIMKFVISIKLLKRIRSMRKITGKYEPINWGVFPTLSTHRLYIYILLASKFNTY